jgi:hypothetical protein
VEIAHPLTKENESLEDDIEDLLADTDLQVQVVKDGVVVLSGSSPTNEDLAFNHRYLNKLNSSPREGAPSSFQLWPLIVY